MMGLLDHVLVERDFVCDCVQLRMCVAVCIPVVTY